MSSKPPKIDRREFEDLLKILKARVPHYVPEWEEPASGEKSPGNALLKILSHTAGAVISRLNQVPYKHFAAFLDMLGFKLLPAQPAGVPLTFKLAEGTDKEVLIPRRSQAAADAADEREEIPFESEKNLLAVPSLLKKVISIDPGKDAIYLPPPKFLDGELQTRDSLTYTYELVSTSGAETKTLQLDHVTGLEEGDFLKLEKRNVNGNNKECVNKYVIISAISGTIVTITHKFGKEETFDAGTAVEKLVVFPLQDGKNMQQHCLYIGHKDLFNIKSKAQFKLEFTLSTRSETGNTPLNVLWEYWGEVEGEEGEEWHTINTPAITNGFSMQGTIELIKTAGGEIKEKEIAGLNSRWIRCRWEGPLVDGAAGNLPAVDGIKLKVGSSSDDTQKPLPDMAFNNDIPLDTSILDPDNLDTDKPLKPLNPLGKEPRMYDTFSIACKEAFSKKGAKVTLDIGVEPRGILGPPAAIEFPEGEYVTTYTRVFARGTYGRLMELKIKPVELNEEIEWEDHGSPPNGFVEDEGTPAVVDDEAESFLSVFVITKDGRLAERFFNGDQWQWLDHGTPGDDITLKFDPAGVFDRGSKLMAVFAADSEGNLQEFFRSTEDDKTTGEWINHGKPDGISIAESPCVDWYIEKTSSILDRAVAYPQPYGIKVFLTGDDGNLYELDCTAGNKDNYQEQDEWKTDYGSPTDTIIVNSKPFAQFSKKNGATEDKYAVVFVKGDDGQLWEFDTKNKDWGNSHGKPMDENEQEINIASAPHGLVEFYGQIPYAKCIFVRGEDGSLYEWNKNESQNNGWKAHGKPANSELNFSPFFIRLSNGFHIFSAGTRQSIIERKITIENEKTWNEYKDQYETAINPTLSWEYWNGKGWLAIDEKFTDDTSNLLKSGQISFNIKKDIADTEVAGQKNYWIRARLVGGDYGKETIAISTKTEDVTQTTEQQTISTKDSIRPPQINKMTIAYNYTNDGQFPEHCLTYNNLQYIDRTEENKTENKHFPPFIQLEEKHKTLYLGFDKFFKGGPVKIFFNAKELEFTEEDKPKLEWQYARKEDWKEMTCNDFTESLIKPDILELLSHGDFSAQSLFGNYLYWLKASLVKGTYEEDHKPLLKGIHPNTTRALQGQTFTEEILGSGSGEAGQTFTFLNTPVQKGQEVRVLETIPEDEKQALINNGGKDAVKEITGEEEDSIENWVLWTEVEDFFDSTGKDRHYTLDPAAGIIQFGDGAHGMIPPVGEDNIKAFSYQAGGGSAGNVDAGEIKTLKSATANVDGVLNPTAADSGADTATLQQMMVIAPAVISHRNRAVTREDFEWMVKQASRKIVKARCLPNINNNGEKQAGWVTVVIVPDSIEPYPTPSYQLRRTAKKYLDAHAANTLLQPQHIHVTGPGYSKIAVSVQIIVTSIDDAVEVESTARKKLDAFFHPLSGGPEERGWDFGRNVAASDVYALLEGIQHVDYVQSLAFNKDGKTIGEDILEIHEDSLAANGNHTIDIGINPKMKQGG